MNSLTQYGASIAIYVVSFLFTATLAGLAQIFAQSYRPIRLAPSVTQNSRPNRIFWILSMMVPLLLSALRWKVGTDYTTYVDLYHSFANIDSLALFFQNIIDTEPSFIILNMLVKVVFNHYLFVFAFSALLILAFFYRSIEDYHEQSSVMLAVVVFLFLIFLTSLNIVRQMIAVAIVFYATRYVFTRNYKKAVIWLIVALSFHYSALIIVPFWLLRGEKRWQKNTRIILFIVLVFMVIGDLLFRSAFEQLPLMGLLAQNTGQGATLSYGLLVLRLPIIIPVIIFRERLIAHDERNYYWIILVIFEVAFSHFGYIFDVFNRVALYFAVSWVVLLPALVRCMPTRRAQHRMGAYIVVVVVALWVYNTVMHNYGDVLPYNTVFDAFFNGML